MNISVKSPMRAWNEGSEIETKPFNNRSHVLSFKIGNAPFCGRSDPLYDEPTPVRRDIKGLAAHGACGIRTGTTLFPTVKASCMEFMTTIQLAGRVLTSHACEAHGTLRSPVLPTLILAHPLDLLFTWGS